jgi:hypothetical protein
MSNSEKSWKKIKKSEKRFKVQELELGISQCGKLNIGIMTNIKNYRADMNKIKNQR